MLKVIEWSDSSSDTMVYKYPMTDRYEIMRGSKLVVRESQAAIFVNQGQIADVFTAGTYELDTDNLPILTALMSWKYAFETPIKCDVYYVNMKQFNNQKWGTSNPIMMRDKDFGMIRLAGHGEFSFRVVEPSTFMKECFGTMHSFETKDIYEHLKSVVISEISDMLGECQIPALDLAANYLEIGQSTCEHASASFKRLGLDVSQILIRNLKLPEDVEKAMDKRTSMGVFGGKMGEYAQYESIQAMRDAAKNEGAGGTFASAGIGVGMGAQLGNQFANSMNAAKNQEPTIKCSKCGATMKESAKFCPECGAKHLAQGKMECPKCGAPISANAKFCPQCGQSMKNSCPKCGADVKVNAKFCPECGEKL